MAKVKPRRGGGPSRQKKQHGRKKRFRHKDLEDLHYAVLEKSRKKRQAAIDVTHQESSEMEAPDDDSNFYEDEEPLQSFDVNPVEAPALNQLLSLLASDDSEGEIDDELNIEADNATSNAERVALSRPDYVAAESNTPCSALSSTCDSVSTAPPQSFPQQLKEFRSDKSPESVAFVAAVPPENRVSGKGKSSFVVGGTTCSANGVRTEQSDDTSPDTSSEPTSSDSESSEESVDVQEVAYCHLLPNLEGYGTSALLSNVPEIVRDQNPEFSFDFYNAPLNTRLNDKCKLEGSTELRPVGYSSYQISSNVPGTNTTNLDHIQLLSQSFSANALSWLDTAKVCTPSSTPETFRATERCTQQSVFGHSCKLLENWNSSVAPRLKRAQLRWGLYSTEVDHESERQKFATFYDFLTHYLDVYYADEQLHTSATVRALSMLHVASHLSSVRQTLLRHNVALRRRISDGKKNLEETMIQKPLEEKKKLLATTGVCKDTAPPNEINAADDDDDNALRDQGFTQPRVLILAPTRCIAKEMVDTLLALLPRVKQIRHKKRYEMEFGPEHDDGLQAVHNRSQNLGEDELATGEALLNEGKPPDYAELFRGNTNDQFRLGIRLHSSGVTLYAPFYKSDIIVASPLGLQLIIGAKGAEKRDYDFLSSIELLIIDRADVLRMQNWAHVVEVLRTTNVKPQKWHSGCDIRRLRQSYADGHARHFRQTVVLSQGRFSECLGLFSSPQSPPQAALCENTRGFVKLFCNSTGSVAQQASLRVAKQLFMSVPCAAHTEIHEALLTFLASQFPPPFLTPTLSTANDMTGHRLLLVVPSYVEYLRVRRVLKTSKQIMADPRDLRVFRSCHEYSSNKMLTTSRQMFRTGQVNLVVTTERFLFYRRYLLKGADHVVFYQPLEYPALYLHCLDMLNDPARGIALTLFTKFHALQCERYLGPSRTTALFRSIPDIPKVFVLKNDDNS